ncbi:MAG: hypothetical protein WCZ89_08780 [Phycisphaerae bacterium]
MRERLSVLCRINHIFTAVILLLAAQAAQGRGRFNIYLNGEPNEPESLLYCPPEQHRGADMLNWDVQPFRMNKS